MIEANMSPDIKFIGRFVNVFTDRRPISDGFGLGPGFKAVAQGVHVAVRADAGVPK